MGDNTGSHTLIGTGGYVTAGANPNQTGVIYNLTGVVSTFNISSAVGSSVTVNNVASVANNLNFDTLGGAITMGTLSGAIGTVNTTIDGGGSFTVGQTVLGVLNNGSVIFAPSGNGGGSVIIGNAGSFINVSITSAVFGFTNNADVIDDRGLRFTGSTKYSISGPGYGLQTISITQGTTTFTFTTIAAFLTAGAFTDLTTGPLKLSADGTGGTRVTVCFLRGTRLATPGGEIAVEALRVGDMVATRLDGETVMRPVTWIGNRRMDAGSDAVPEAYPVRVQAGAFADGVPHRDLLVTAEHCLHVDGRLIPARMLVNGRSIRVDTDIAQYEYFHVELDQHAILIAEGLEAESYLDTGNRGNFANVAVAALRPNFSVDADHKSWQQDAAAPLAVDRETVEPVWRSLLARCDRLGIGTSRPPVALAQDPELHLLTNDGAVILPAIHAGNLYSFDIPTNAGTLTLASRASRPSDVVGPYLDDRRALGVLIGGIALSDGSRKIAVDAHLTAAVLPGWHGQECAEMRWTNGYADLPVRLADCDGTRATLWIEVVQAGPYLAEPVPSWNRAAEAA